MSNVPSIRPFQRVLAYPFEDPYWKSKLLIGMALTLGGMMLPVIPTLFVLGYAYQIIHRLIVEQGDLYLPEWKDWERLFKDGWRLFSVSFLYFLPMVICIVLGFVVYFGAFGITMAASGGSSNNPAAGLLMFGGMAAQFLLMALGMLLSIALAFVMPAVLGHTVAHDSFSAGFDFIGWWKVLKANFAGFLLAVVMTMGMVMLMTLIMQVFYMTILLICLAILVPVVASFYMLLVTSALIGLAYREGVEKLQPAVIVPEIKPVEAVLETPAEPVKPRDKRIKKSE